MDVNRFLNNFFITAVYARGAIKPLNLHASSTCRRQVWIVSTYKPTARFGVCRCEYALRSYLFLSLNAIIATPISFIFGSGECKVRLVTPCQMLVAIFCSNVATMRGSSMCLISFEVFLLCWLVRLDSYIFIWIWKEYDPDICTPPSCMISSFNEISGKWWQTFVAMRDWGNGPSLCG